jgi:hypothetical protein
VSASNKIDCVQSSNSTSTQTVDELAEDTEEQPLQRIKESSYCLLQIDGSTDIIWRSTGVRYEHAHDVREEMLCSTELASNATAVAVFKPLIISLLTMLWTGNVALLYALKEQQ